MARSLTECLRGQRTSKLPWQTSSIQLRLPTIDSPATCCRLRTGSYLLPYVPLEPVTSTHTHHSLNSRPDFVLTETQYQTALPATTREGQPAIITSSPKYLGSPLAPGTAKTTRAAAYSGSTQTPLERSMQPQQSPFQNATSQVQQQPTLYSNVGTNSPSAGQRSSTIRPFTPIAPDPQGLQRLQAIKQSQEFDEASEASRAKKRRLTASSMEPAAPPALREEERLLLSLKDDQSLPWKDIAAKFGAETGKVHMIPALQMRYKRLKERLQVWTEADVEALKQAHEYWEMRKFDIISAKVCTDFPETYA